MHGQTSISSFILLDDRDAGDDDDDGDDKDTLRAVQTDLLREKSWAERLAAARVHRSAEMRAAAWVGTKAQTSAQNWAG